MTVRSLNEKQKKHHFCRFEYFQGSERRECGKPAVARIGKGYACQEHLEYSLSVFPSPVEKAVIERR